MTSSSESHPPSDDWDNLTVIRGIGTAKQQWLWDIGVYNLTHLAHASVPDVMAQLQQQGRPVSQRDLQRWIAQAQAQILQTAELPSAAIAPPAPSEPVTDKPSAAAQPTVAEQTSAQPIPTVEILQLQLFQSAGPPLIASKAQPQFMGTVQPHVPLTLEAVVRVTVPPTALHHRQSTEGRITLQCFVTHLASGRLVHLGTQTRSVVLNESVPLTIRLPNLQLSQPGIYRLQVVATLESGLATMGWFEVPLFQVLQ